jgi:hypothetical protein
MESQIKVVDKLIEEGEGFTFQNFCLNTASYPGQYGGADTPEWGTYCRKTTCG